MSEELNIGIQLLPKDLKAKYFAKLEGEEGHLLDDTIDWDRQYLLQHSIPVEGLKTFLLGGCGSALSLSTMRDFIKGIRGDRPTKLIVTDLEDLAVKRMKPAIGDEILFQSDLLDPAIGSDSVGYIRLDFLQNFISPEKQLSLLKSLKRIVCANGIISSVLYMTCLDAVKQLGTEISGKFNHSRVFNSNAEEVSFNYLCLSKEFLSRLCREAGLILTFSFNKTEDFEDGKVDCQHVVMQKK